jgi:hypothetical protein
VQFVEIHGGTEENFEKAQLSNWLLRFPYGTSNSLEKRTLLLSLQILKEKKRKYFSAPCSLLSLRTLLL